MTSRWIARAVPVLVLAGLLLGPQAQTQAQAAPAAAVRLAAQGVPAHAPSAQLRHSAADSATLVDSDKKKDKGKDKKGKKSKKKSFFKKLGAAALIGTVLVVLLVIAVIVAIVFAVRRRRRQA
ncbi:hypothetical protein EDE04_7242 [Streptomyces sp. 2132.2]|uniref:hypothetical protein n=1 Tax=Streptomyces TaxID=1883 RepID=UPI000F461039|nr:hypothetical protein [Streptomyces sp. 2132.2]ROQ88850.1 hypothetical protein EDE04_7242 [Streptomyces sp. 2132.2]